MKKYICPVCHNEEHPARARFCMVCGTAFPMEEQPRDESLETVKLLAVAAICYQRILDEIMRRTKDSPDIADLFVNIPTVQYTPNCRKLWALEKSGIDVNVLKSIDEVTEVMCRGMEAPHG